MMDSPILGGRKSRHYRNESDPLLGMYSSTLAASTRSLSNSNRSNSISLMDGGYGSYMMNYVFSQKEGGEDNEESTSAAAAADAEASKSTSTTTAKSATKKKKKKKKRGGYRVHRVSYTAQNHVQVLFRTYASAFPQVLPFVCANVTWTLVIYYLKINDVIDLTFHSSVGHSFMGLLVSFLIVSRSKISYDRFMEFRRHLAACYRACRELAQYTTVYTFQTQTEDAAWWRQEVCFRTILLLRVTMDALLWSSTQREEWEDEYFIFNQEKDGGNKNLSRVSKHFYRAKQLTHGRRSFIDENFRAPVNFAHVLRQIIMEHDHYLGHKMAVNEYRDLLQFVAHFIDAFHGFRVLIFTPYPFPLLQMTRAFLFFWVYTLPMVLLKDYRPWSSVFIVILVSFGFIGIEYVSMSLDDPFSDDTNDVDEHGMSLLVYEDIYLAIYRTDGPDAAMGLRERVLDRYRQGRELDCYRDDLKGYDIWEAPEWLFEDQRQYADDSGDDAQV